VGRRRLADVGEDRDQHDGRKRAGTPTNKIVTRDSSESRKPANASDPPRSWSARSTEVQPGDVEELHDRATASQDERRGVAL
jgi:hypothetical protein